MADIGIRAHICFQNAGVTRPGMPMPPGDSEPAVDNLRIFNDASIEYEVESGQHLFNMAHLPCLGKVIDPGTELDFCKAGDVAMRGSLPVPRKLEVLRGEGTPSR